MEAVKKKMIFLTLMLKLMQKNLTIQELNQELLVNLYVLLDVQKQVVLTVIAVNSEELDWQGFNRGSVLILR